MSDFKWDDFQEEQKPSTQTASFNWDDQEVESSFGDQVKAAVLGLGEGASFGFLDEIGAAGSAGMNALTGVTGPLAGRDFKSIKDDYKNQRNLLRADMKEAQEKAPVVSGVSNLIGATGSAILTGNPSTLAGRVGMSGTVGALAGAGSSEAESAQDLLIDSVLGAGMGVAFQYGAEKALPAIGRGIKSAASKVDSYIDPLMTKIGKITANVPEEATERYLQRSSAIKNAKSREDLVESLIGEEGALDQLRGYVAAKDSIAWNALSNEPKMLASEITDAGESYIKNILGGKRELLTRESGVGASSDKIKAVSKIIEEIKDAYKNGNISEADLKSIIQDLQKKAYTEAGSPRTSIGAEATREFSGQLNSLLKSNNPAYEELMRPVAEIGRAHV